MMRNTLILLLTFVALCLTFYGTAGDTTREQVLESRNRRKEQIKNLVKDAKRKLADHDSGEKVLTDEEKDQLQRNVDLFQRKVESMEEELEEWVCICKARVLKPSFIIWSQISHVHFLLVLIGNRTIGGSGSRTRQKAS